MNALFKCPVCRYAVVNKNAAETAKCIVCSSEFIKRSNDEYRLITVNLDDLKSVNESQQIANSNNVLELSNQLIEVFFRKRTMIDYPNSMSKYQWDIIANNKNNSKNWYGKFISWLAIEVGRDFAYTGLPFIYIGILILLGYITGIYKYIAEYRKLILSVGVLSTLIFFIFRALFRTRKIKIDDAVSSADFILNLINQYQIPDIGEKDDLKKEWKKFSKEVKEEIFTSFFMSPITHKNMTISRLDAEILAEWIWLINDYKPFRDSIRNYQSKLD